MCIHVQWDDHYIFLIMEFCNGGDLSTFIKSRTVLREYVARKFLRQLGKANVPNLCILDLGRVCGYYVVH